MKTPIKWLKEYVDITLPPAELARRLTLAGFEVAEVISAGGDWDNVVIGWISAVGPHPNADRLRLATVDLGGEQQTVVCGAPNLTPGDKIAFARVGAILIDPHSGEKAKLKPARIRGVESSGMVCAERELGISDDYSGVLVLPPEAPVGTPLADYLGDAVFDLDITPNRPDCLSVTGIAREVAALTGQQMHIPEVSYPESASPIGRQVAIEIADAGLCPRYCASLISGVKIAPSPAWMQERLLACGMRPINNIVDITNYVMLEYGQPLHAFDYSKVKGQKIIVRRARDGEGITSLDGTAHTLSSGTLVIADADRAVAIAGVMGGANSEVTENTTSILLESASFKPSSIYYTARQLSLASEASMRFERGIRPELTLPALRHATRLMLELAGGEAANGIADVYPGRQERPPIRLSAAEVRRLLGIELSAEQITGALTSLGFDCRPDGAGITVATPYWRSDINLPVDLIEEVARIIGYDRIPLTLLGQPLPPQEPAPAISLKQVARQCLAGYGFQEVVTYSLNSLEALQKLLPRSGSPQPPPLRLVNPMTADLEYLRPHLRANLLAALADNRRHDDGVINLFELGKVYLPRPDDLPAEPYVLCGLMGGTREDRSWLGGGEPADFYDAKGVIEGLLGRLGVTAKFEPSDDESLHPAQQAAIIIGKDRPGVIGQVHPRVADAFDIAEPAYLFEINLTALLPFTAGHRLFQPVPRFPETVRDMALILPDEVTHQQVQDIITGFPLVSQLSLFDVYTGKQVPPDKKSLAYRLVYQSAEHTLTDEEVDRVQQKILNRLNRELGATLRG